MSRVMSAEPPETSFRKMSAKEPVTVANVFGNQNGNRIGKYPQAKVPGTSPEVPARSCRGRPATARGRLEPSPECPCRPDAACESLSHRANRAGASAVSRARRIKPSTLEGRKRQADLGRIISNPRTSKADRVAALEQLDRIAPI